MRRMVSLWLLMAQVAVGTAAPAESPSRTPLSEVAEALTDDSSAWPMFGRDAQHTNATTVEWRSDPKPLWTFRPSEHLWTYTRRTSVWSSSPVAARLGDDLRIFVGSYDRNCYCVDAKTGREVWRFTTGGAINAAPALYRIAGRLCVVVASTDRTIYGLDGRTGERLWSYAVYPWTFTAFEAIASSPIVIEDAGAPSLLVAMWYSDRRPLRNVQRGELICLDGRTGRCRWRETLSRSALSSPAAADIHGMPSVFVAGADGTLACLDPRNGRRRWTMPSTIPFTSSPLLSRINGRPVVIAGTLFGVLFCVDAETGTVVWTRKTGMQISSAGMVTHLSGRPALFVPSYDRFLYSVDLTSGVLRWRFETTHHIASSPILARIEGALCVLFASLDNHLYAVDASTGRLRWSYPLGKRPWFYEVRGETLWPSPIAIAYEDRPLLIVPWYDGTITAFSDW